jgi:mannose-1-phosphate guanylyltransferase
MLTGFVLAAGFGTRLQPITSHVPKALVSVCGKPLLERSLAFLHANGIERIGVNAHAFAEQLIDYKSNSSFDFTLFHETGDIRGTGGAFSFAHDFLVESDVFFVCNVDILANIDLRAAYAAFVSSGAIAGLIAVPAENGNGSIYLDAKTNEYCGARSENRVLNEHSADFIGMAFYRKEFLSLVTQDDFSIVPVWKRAQQTGHKITVLCTPPDTYWADAGTPRDLAHIHFDVLDNRLTLDIPQGICVDIHAKKAYHYKLPANCVSQFGPYTWCESPHGFSGSVPVAHSVIFNNAIIPDSGTIHNALLTPWGRIDFD